MIDTSWVDLDCTCGIGHEPGHIFRYWDHLLGKCQKADAFSRYLKQVLERTEFRDIMAKREF